MIFKRLQEGDVKIIESFCIFPLFTKEEIFWIEKVRKHYEYQFYLRTPYNRLCAWELVKVERLE